MAKMYNGQLNCRCALTRRQKHSGSFPFVPPPPQYVMLLTVTMHVSVHSKALNNNLASARVGGGVCK